MAVTLALMVPGLLVGLWFTDGWRSQWVAVQVTALCAVAAVVLGYTGWRLAGRVIGRRRARPPAPRILRVLLRGEVAVVVPPHPGGARAAGVSVVLVGVVAWLAVATLAVRTGAMRPDRVQVLVPVAALAAAELVGLLGERFGPRVALFPDRIEIRRGTGRFLVPWEAVAAVGEHEGQVMIYLSRAQLTSRQGWIRRHRAYGIPIRNLGASADAVINAIELYRHDPTTLTQSTSPAAP